MQMMNHLCGQELERGTGPHGAYLAAKPIGHARVHHVEVECCPRCGETLCDTDCTDRSGAPLVVNSPSAWSSERRAALAGLAAAGYTLRYDSDPPGGWWRIGAPGVDYDIASSDNLDAVVELAAALTAGQIPIRLYWNWLSGGTEHIWQGVYSPATGRALGGAAMGQPEQIRVTIDGTRVEFQRGDDAPQVGTLWRRTDALIEVEFFAGS